MSLKKKLDAISKDRDDMAKVMDTLLNLTERLMAKQISEDSFPRIQEILARCRFVLEQSNLKYGDPDMAEGETVNEKAEA